MVVPRAWYVSIGGFCRLSPLLLNCGPLFSPLLLSCGPLLLCPELVGDDTKTVSSPTALGTDD
eukprot:SAG11_NODE_18491_length_489_cov_1.982051_1_plen_63_part_00